MVIPDWSLYSMPKKAANREQNNKSTMTHMFFVVTFAVKRIILMETRFL